MAALQCRTRLARHPSTSPLECAGVQVGRAPGFAAFGGPARADRSGESAGGDVCAPFAHPHAAWNALLIEHDIVGEEVRERRGHFAIVCASTSCPARRGEAYHATTLDSQLTQAARRVVSDTSRNRFDVASRRLRLSSLFGWFREDFERSSQTLPPFVAWPAEPATTTALPCGGDAGVELLDDDGALNGR